MTTDLQRIADELEIRNLVARLVWHADTTTTADLDAYAACFTEDAEWEMFGNRLVGRDAIRAGAVERRRTGVNGPGSGVRHGLMATVVDFHGSDEAVARSYVQAYRNLDGTAAVPELFLMGEYHDTYRRTPAGWRLAERRVSFDAP